LVVTIAAKKDLYVSYVKIFFFLSLSKQLSMPMRNKALQGMNPLKGDKDIEQAKDLRKDRDLPATSDINKSRDDIQHRNQDEFDDESKQKRDNNLRRQEARNERREDSQLNEERNIDPEKKKQSPKADKVERQFPNLKK